MEFAIDMSREQLIATGTVRPVDQFVENAPRNTVRPQEVNDAGVPLWEIDVFKAVVQFGKQTTIVLAVRVPAPKQPEVAQFQPLALEHPTVSFYQGRGGALRTNIAAAGIAAPTPSRGRSSEAA